MDTIDEYTEKAWIFIICSVLMGLYVGYLNATVY